MLLSCVSAHGHIGHASSVRIQGREAHAPSQRAPEDGEALVRQLINGQVAEPWLRHGCETTGALCTNYVR